MNLTDQGGLAKEVEDNAGIVVDHAAGHGRQQCHHGLRPLANTCWPTTFSRGAAMLNVSLVGHVGSGLRQAMAWPDFRRAKWAEDGPTRFGLAAGLLEAQSVLTPFGWSF